MITLTRKLGEAIQIGDDVKIIIREIRQNSVRITIDASIETKIWRLEVYERIQQEEKDE